MDGFTHDSVNNKTIEWYTPAYVVETLRRCGGVFELDPCAPLGGVDWLNIPEFYHVENCGMKNDWGVRPVWLNPPYGNKTGTWLAKAANHQNAIALVFARTDCKWFHDAVAKASGLLFLKGRIKFVDAMNITAGNGAGAGSLLIAFGKQNADVLKRASQTNELAGLFVQLGEI